MSYSKSDFEGYFDDKDEEMVQDEKKRLFEMKKLVRGYTQIWNYKKRANGTLKKTQVDLYTSGFIGSNIRNAETGEFYPFLVGSAHEDRFFKVILATGESKSKNGSNILFYTSPEHYMKYFNINLKQASINKWNAKYDKYLGNQIESRIQKRASTIV